jgi:hypothetical protein
MLELPRTWDSGHKGAGDMRFFSSLAKLVIDHADDLCIGIVASLVVLAFQVTVSTVARTLTYVVTSRIRLFRLYGFDRGSSIYVVSGSLPLGRDPDLAYLAGPDATAASNVLQSLKNVYQESCIRHRYATREEVHTLHENIVAIGGPVFNSCTRRMLELISDLIQFDADDNLKFFGAAFSQSSTEHVDYGLVIRHSNPFAPGKKIAVVAGCGSHGVLAASMLYDQTRRFAGLAKELGRSRGFLNRTLNRDFACVVKCHVTGSDIANIAVVAVRSVRGATNGQSDRWA